MNERELFGILAEEKSIQSAAKSLIENGIQTFIAKNADEAKEMVLEILPSGAEVMTMTSVTLDSLGLSQQINESGKYDSVKKKLSTMNRENQGNEMQKIGAAPDWAIGSVHAVTEDGKVMIASATGSQLPAYAYGAAHIIWVVGAQKIVTDVAEGIRRIYEYVFPLENERAMKAYGIGSGVNKLLTINKEVSLGRIKMIIVKEKLGF